MKLEIATVWMTAQQPWYKLRCSGLLPSLRSCISVRICSNGYVTAIAAAPPKDPASACTSKSVIYLSNIVKTLTCKEVVISII
jgi:hypothetical protein